MTALRKTYAKNHICRLNVSGCLVSLAGKWFVNTGDKKRIRITGVRLRRKLFTMIAKLKASAVALMCLAGAAYAAPIAPEDVQIVDGAVEASLTGGVGDPASGREIFANRSLGNCLACHAVTDQSDQQFHGEVGPPLDGVADRWSEGELRAILVDSKKTLYDETIMPGFYTLEVGADVREDLIGKTILTAQEVEDVVAYLTTLKE